MGVNSRSALQFRELSRRLCIAVDIVDKVQLLTARSLILELIFAALAIERIASSRRWAAPRTKCCSGASWLRDPNALYRHGQE